MGFALGGHGGGPDACLGCRGGRLDGAKPDPPGAVQWSLSRRLREGWRLDQGDWSDRRDDDDGVAGNDYTIGGVALGADLGWRRPG